MKEFLGILEELRDRATELKRMVSESPALSGAAMRQALYQLDAELHVIERNAAVVRGTLPMAVGLLDERPNI